MVWFHLSSQRASTRRLLAVYGRESSIRALRSSLAAPYLLAQLGIFLVYLKTPEALVIDLHPENAIEDLELVPPSCWPSDLEMLKTMSHL